VARKKKHAEHANHERWLVSYADFITLLFAFFVVMFASSQTDKAKAQRISEAVTDALDKGGVKAIVHEVLGGTVDDKGVGNAMMKGPGGSQPKNVPNTPPPPEDKDLMPKMMYLNKMLENEIKDGKLEIRQEARGLVIKTQAGAFFPSGDDTIDPARLQIINKIATLFKDTPNAIRLEGHTDSRPIHTARFNSNYELSAARGIAMLETMHRYGIAYDRLAVVGYADTLPVAPNDTEENRAKNRRVDIVIVSQPIKDKPKEPAAEPTPPIVPASAKPDPTAKPAPPKKK